MHIGDRAREPDRLLQRVLGDVRLELRFAVVHVGAAGSDEHQKRVGMGPTYVVPDPEQERQPLVRDEAARVHDDLAVRADPELAPESQLLLGRGGAESRGIHAVRDSMDELRPHALGAKLRFDL
jgi:hypothetical protein